MVGFQFVGNWLAIGFANTILSKIERSERKATKEQIVKLAKILDLKEEDLLVQYLSEKILYEIKDEKLGQKALKVAEQKMKYINKNKSGN